MRYVVEVLTQSPPGQTADWILLASHDASQPAVAAAAYEAAKHRYRRARLRREDGQVIVDSGAPGLTQLEPTAPRRPHPR